MAEYTITIEGDELEELQEIVAAIQTEQPLSKTTEQSYVQSLVSGHLQTRITNAYVTIVQSKTPTELKTLLGSRLEISRGK